MATQSRTAPRSQMNWYSPRSWAKALASEIWSGGNAAACEVQGPWQPMVRTAVLDSWFDVTGSAKKFDPFSLAAVRDYNPQALAGTVSSLRALAESALSHPLNLLGLQYGILAFVGIEKPLLEETDRDLLWRAFGLPVYQQFRSWSGGLLASECEAHAGLHIDTAKAVFRNAPNSTELLVAAKGDESQPSLVLPAGIDARITDVTCPCGCPGPRLIALRKQREPLVPEYAVSA